jgi:hypothetical protein
MRGYAARVCRLDMYKQGWVFCLLSTFKGQVAWTDIGLGWSYPKLKAVHISILDALGIEKLSYLPKY